MKISLSLCDNEKTQDETDRKRNLQMQSNMIYQMNPKREEV